MRKIKVLRVITDETVVPWHLNNTLKRHLIDDDLEVFVVGNNVSKFKKQYSWVHFIDWSVQRKPNLVKDIFSLFSLVGLIIKIKPDIVHSIMPKASLLSAVASFLCRVPIRMHTYTGQMWNLNKKYKKSYLYWFDRFVNFLNTHNLTDSPSQSLFLYERGFNKHGRSIPCLGSGSLSGVDFSSIKINQNNVLDITNRYNLEEKFVCLFLARKHPEKGVFDVLNIFNEFNIHGNAKLLLIGPDATNGQLTNLKAEKPGMFTDVIELDSVSNPYDYIKCSHVLLIPSLREGFGSIVIDAASLGVPAIGTKIVGLIDSISDGETGILVEPGNILKFVGALNYLYTNHDLYDCFRMACIERSRSKFDADLLHSKLVSLYKNIYFNKYE